ncbi:AAA family ATPase [Amycolatopsis orientalis]|uniref:AAA family ATPase n=1 Tax=Amycolatopsis orientalis TaxID=31958 RepID=UPI0009F463FE|nr:AAA family ATPase [Amycolatopsis orientalis]
MTGNDDATLPLEEETQQDEPDVADIKRLLTIDSITFQRFKQFENSTITLNPGVTLVAGGNNSGKTSLLHGLAVWEFCRTATIMERGPEGILPDPEAKRQGFGLGDEQFSPINVPTLKHLWTNLKTTHVKGSTDPGYTLKLSCRWKHGEETKELGFALALVNDRLFIKTSNSNLASGDPTPRIAYLPPFAGIRSREERINGAIRRRRIGEGLAGAVLRNMLLDLQISNQAKRNELKARPAADGRPRTKISGADLRQLREQDPWELLMQALRVVFGAELTVRDFREEYHSYIEVLVDKGTVEGFNMKRHNGYNPRDLMVEGSGFLQWLSVYTLATSPDADVLLFDEPDAHLHPTLQQEMLRRLDAIANSVGKQVLLATHSSEILRHADPARILEIRRGRSARYLGKEHQKVGLLEGLGSDYAPRIDRAQQTRRILFVEGTSDIPILKNLALAAGIPWHEEWVEWLSTAPQRDRKSLWSALCEDIPGIVAVSLRDRDDEPIRTVGDNLRDRNYAEISDFKACKWRRRYIEGYLLWPPALAACSGRTEDSVVDYMRDQHGIAVGANFTDRDAPQAIMDVRAKEILKGLSVNAVDLSKYIPGSAICDDIRDFLAILDGFNYEK